jgi:hypothetical protein
MWPSMSLTLAGSIGSSCHGDGGHEGVPAAGAHRMKRIAFLLVAVAVGTGAVAYMAPAPASGQADGQGAPRFVTKIPPGYRNWRLISVAHEEGDLNSLGAILGNDIAIKAYREGKLPFPDGAIVAALHWRYVPSGDSVTSWTANLARRRS